MHDHVTTHATCTHAHTHTRTLTTCTAQHTTCTGIHRFTNNKSRQENNNHYNTTLQLHFTFSTYNYKTICSLLLLVSLGKLYCWSRVWGLEKSGPWGWVWKSPRSWKIHSLKWKVLEKMDQPEGPPNERKGSLVMGPLPLVPVFSQVNGAQAFAREEKIINFSLFLNAWTEQTHFDCKNKGNRNLVIGIGSSKGNKFGIR